MSKFLVSFYPIRPWRGFLCFEINDKLTPNDEPWNLLEEYRRGLEKNGLKEGDLLYFNNSSWMLVEAKSIFTAIEKFKERLFNDCEGNA